MDNPKFFYANSSVAGFSPVDFTLVFQRRGLLNEEIPTQGGRTQVAVAQQTTILERVDVSVAPGHMKILVANVIETLLLFEAQQGTIALPPADQTAFDATIGKLLALNKS